MSDGSSGAEMVDIAAYGGEGYGRTRYLVSRVVAGDPDSVRPGLLVALAALEYRVRGGQSPIVALREGARSSRTKNLLTGNALPYVRRLEIALAPHGSGATTVEFEYSVMNSAITKGDRKTLEVEAEALLALAARPDARGVCSTCGKALSENARYCRACGAPGEAREPAEIEVLRLTAHARSALQRSTWGLVTMVAWAAFVLTLFALSHRTLLDLALVLGAGELFGAFWVVAGVWRLHRALNPAGASRGTIGEGPELAPPQLGGPTAGRLIAPPSVTEGTTRHLERDGTTGEAGDQPGQP